MTKTLILAALFSIGTTAGTVARASTLDSLDLVLRVESVGFTDVIVEDADGTITDEFEFLDTRRDIWGLERSFERFDVGDEVRLTAQIDPLSGTASGCMIGGFACSRTWLPGLVGGNLFSFGDGSGGTPWFDFILEGGTEVGDEAILATFEGAPSFVTLFDGGAYAGMASWDKDVRNFTVVRNNLMVTPLPASSVLLIAALGGLVVMRRTKGRQS